MPFMKAKALNERDSLYRNQANFANPAGKRFAAMA
jgi:hypothetical protein